jgi:hypothetical protein
MSDHSNRSRRTILKLAGAGSVAIAIPSIGPAVAGGHLPKLKLDDPTAKALAYIEKSETPGQWCNNCQLYTGKPDKAWGGCAIFPGKEVAAEGWCKSWVKKAG